MHHRTSLFLGIALASVTLGNAAPPVIDDQAIFKSLVESMEKFVGTEGCPSADDLAKAANESLHLSPSIPLPEPPTSPKDTSYERLSHSVFLVGSIYNCGKCHKWHKGGTATAWCLGSDGLLVTNAHVFRGAKGGAMAVVDREGNCYPVTALVGIDVASDVAVFQVKAKDLSPLPLGPDAEVGAPVTVISNPSGNLFMRTSGAVSRYSRGAGNENSEVVTWMAITADYAKGSSGGPVFNEAGEVVGMVSRTNSIYADSKNAKPKQVEQGQLQMVVKSCVPVDSVRKLFSKE